MLITAGLLGRGLARSQAADPGFETRDSYLLLGDFGKDPVKALDLERRLFERLRALPEVKDAAWGGVPMMGTWTPPMYVDTLRGRTLASYATEEYFSTIGIPLLDGRPFSTVEVDRNANVAVISEAAARQFWRGGDPLGKRFKLDLAFDGKLAEFVVVGVAKDVRYANLTRIDPAHVYLTPDRTGRNASARFIRIQGNPERAVGAVRATVAALDRNLFASLSLTSIEDGPLRIQKSLAQVDAMFAAILAVLALTLAGIGIYGVMTYLVGQRMKEIGIRIALGASAKNVLGSVIVQGLRPVLVGLALGFAAAAALSYILHSTLAFPGSTDLLYGVPFYDPATFLGLSLFVIVIAVVASVVPARRALRVDPMTALRYE